MFGGIVESWGPRRKWRGWWKRPFLGGGGGSAPAAIVYAGGRPPAAAIGGCCCSCGGGRRAYAVVGARGREGGRGAGRQGGGEQDDEQGDDGDEDKEVSEDGGSGGGGSVGGGGWGLTDNGKEGRERGGAAMEQHRGGKGYRGSSGKGPGKVFSLVRPPGREGMGERGGTRNEPDIIYPSPRASTSKTRASANPPSYPPRGRTGRPKGAPRFSGGACSGPAQAGGVATGATRRGPLPAPCSPSACRR